MRAANQPRSSTAVESNRAHRPVYRLLVALLSTLALLLVWRPAVVHGQEADARIGSVPDTSADQVKDSAATMHVVRAGETLWGIAERYYGDGHQWPALARNNRIAITGLAPLQVGMKLTVPASPSVRSSRLRRAERRTRQGERGEPDGAAASPSRWIVVVADCWQGQCCRWSLDRKGPCARECWKGGQGGQGRGGSSGGGRDRHRREADG